jgi:subtilisin-like proprotein convertase family protein
MTVVRETDDVLRVTIEVGEIRTLDVDTKEGSFTRLIIPGFQSSKDVGQPELPMMNRLFEIPLGATVRTDVVEVETRTIDLGAHGIEHAIFPAQPSMPKSADAASWPFVYDPAAYGVVRVGDELVRVHEMGQLRAMSLGRVDVAPITYFPAEHRIEVAERVTLRLHFDGADAVQEAALKTSTRSPYFRTLYRSIAGDRSGREGESDLVSDVVTMVVVAPPEFETQLQEFVEWKTERGFHTVLAITGTPEVGSTKESIRDYLHELYLNGTPELPAPSFVIFVGDVAQMPTFFEGGDATDRPYCAVGGDLLPDMYYGRFSATNASQLQAILDKTLMYDRFEMPDPSYLADVVMIAGMDSGHGSTWGNGQINYGTGYYFNTAHGLNSYTYLYPESGSHSSDIVQHASDGMAYINYTAHGSETSWADPSFTQSNINSLSNYGKYGLVVGNCCLTSTYDRDECFAETWLRAEDKGAIGYIGGSNSTYWDEDYWWGVGNGPIVSNPTYEETGLGAYDGFFHDHGEPMDQWYVCNDAEIFRGNLAVMEAGSSLTTYYWNIYNLMGDPSLMVYLGVPSDNPVDHPETIFTTSSAVPIDALPGSYVGITQNGALIAAGTVDASGSRDFAVAPGALVPGSARMVVTAQNREPYVADVVVAIPAEVHIVPDVIDAMLETTVVVSVLEADGVTPKPGIEVWAEGFHYTSAVGVTGPDGTCALTIDYPYGPALDIVGKDPADSWNLFRNPIEVIAAPLADVALGVFTDIGIVDQFPFNLPGTLRASRIGGGFPPHELWATLNSTDGVSTTDTELVLVADERGVVAAVFAARGYDLVASEFPVVDVYGSLVGNVDAVGLPAAGAHIRGYDDADELAFETFTDGLGHYDVGSDIVVDTYTVTADLFGYLHWESSHFVNVGENVLDLSLASAPDGVATGVVTESGTGTPLGATIEVYRVDDQTLYDSVSCGVGDGTYTTGALPYFDYLIVASADEHAPDSMLVRIDAPVKELDFALDRVYVEENCRQPALAIPDSNPSGVTDDMEIARSATVHDIRVFVDISHTYQGDLIVRLTSPAGTSVTLHDRSGGGDNDIRGWYPDELSPVQSFDAFLGENLHGTWSLFISDNAGADTGSLDEWCLWFEYGDVVATDEPAASPPAVVALGHAVPNPFNPRTRIGFELPRAGDVSLDVFDVGGRRVATLASGRFEAGTHRVVWEGRDHRGRAVSSGIYFYRLEVNDRTLTRRMTILK